MYLTAYTQVIHCFNGYVNFPVQVNQQLGDRAFVVAGPRALNSLPQFITYHLSEISQQLFI